ncbi:MAG: hypothetical protein JWP22_1227, partial [Ramlibacter sp.]|nr:hypothetical protein [Ramlibacter sp.]
MRSMSPSRMRLLPHHDIGQALPGKSALRNVLWLAALASAASAYQQVQRRIGHAARLTRCSLPYNA